VEVWVSKTARGYNID